VCLHPPLQKGIELQAQLPHLLLHQVKEQAQALSALSIFLSFLLALAPSLVLPLLPPQIPDPHLDLLHLLQYLSLLIAILLFLLWIKQKVNHLKEEYDVLYLNL
jgi:hypothetical protein